MYPYRQAEKLLYTYPVNVMRYQEALMRYMRLTGETDCRAQNYENAGSPINHGDPPGEYTDRLMSAEREVKKYGALVRDVRSMRYELGRNSGRHEGELYQVLELYYFEGMSMKDLAMHLGLNERTVYRRRRELVRGLMRRLDDSVSEN